MSASISHWRAVPREALAVRQWGDEFVVRNELSGATHLLPSLSGRILLALVEAHDGAAVHDLALKLGNNIGARVDETPRFEAIEAALLEFQRLGLVVPQRS